MSTMTYTGTLTILSCWCGIKFAVPENLFNQHRDYHDPEHIWCPIGHKPVWGNRSRVKDLEERLAVERDNVAFWRGRKEEAERRASAQKGVTTRLKKRIAAGVCPCCKRTFQDVVRHMKGQHPDYVGTER